ncbi:MAG TPA: hypothetical protein VHX38_14470 [Pseudonocardiaceae bacterium]|nr:hypothetical protein [Pseudonocardiaceae bacterium]
MQVRTDDEVYRVDAVWLGPPKATFPWRARYVAWGVGILVFLVVLTIQRAVGFGFGFFTVAWGLVITVVVTRFVCSRISHERPLGAVLAMWGRELTSPREAAGGKGGAASATRVRVHATRPRPRRAARAAAATGQPVTQRGGGRSGTAEQRGNAGRVRTVHRSSGRKMAKAKGAPRAVRTRSKEVGGVRTPGRR